MMALFFHPNRDEKIGTGAKEIKVTKMKVEEVTYSESPLETVINMYRLDHARDFGVVWLPFSMLDLI